MRQLFAACIACLVAITGCSNSPSSPVEPSTGTLSAEARVYLDELIGVMEANSLHRQHIDWASFRSEVYRSAGGSQTVYSAIASGVPAALRLLGDHHSLYLTKQGTYIYNPVPLPCSDVHYWPTVLVPESIGYVKVGAFSGQTPTEMTKFAVSVQETIRARDSEGIVGWLVDLRENGGGNMYPMIAGVGPLLGEGFAGAFIGPEGDVDRWGYTNGAAWAEGYPGLRIVAVPAPYQAVRRNPKVAVLTNCGVASSGEAVVVAFRGRPNTRSFGTPTYGVSTSNRGFFLSDGGTLLLTVSTMADRSLTTYGGPVLPDEVTGDPATTLARAIEWLQAH